MTIRRIANHFKLNIIIKFRNDDYKFDFFFEKIPQKVNGILLHVKPNKYA